MSQYSGAQPSARRPPAACGGSVITEPRGARRPPARKHAAGPGTGKSGGEPQRPQPSHAPALEPPQAARLPPRLSQGPAVSSPPRESHSVSFAGPAFGEGPPAARGGSVITEPRGARRPPARKHAAGPGTGKSGGEPQHPQPRHAPALEPPQAARLPPRLSQGPAVSSPPRESHSVSFAGPALGEAPARGPWGFRHHGTSRRQTPTSAQARRRAGNGEERGEPQRPQPRHAPALEPPQAARLPPRLSHGPAVSSPPRTSHSESIAGPALGTAPASGPWGFRHHGTSRRKTPTSAQARRRAGNEEERGRTPAPAT